MIPEPSCQISRIDPGDPTDRIACKKILKSVLRPPAAREAGDISHDKCVRMRLSRLHIRLADPVVPDERVGHNDRLTGVGRIRQDFLITGHRRVENDLRYDLFLPADRPSLIDCTVFQYQKCSQVTLPLRNNNDPPGSVPADHSSQTDLLHVIAKRCSSWKLYEHSNGFRASNNSIAGTVSQVPKLFTGRSSDALSAYQNKVHRASPSPHKDR